MADTVTNTTAALDEPGSNDAGVKGAGTQPATNEVTFSQSQVNEIVKGRLAEQSKKLTEKHESLVAEKLTAALAEKEKTFETTLQSRIASALNEEALKTARLMIQADYGLTEAQIERLKGFTPDEITADAQTLFGSLKTIEQPRRPPVIQTGTKGDDKSLDISQMTPAQVRENRADLLKTLRS